MRLVASEVRVHFGSVRVLQRVSVSLTTGESLAVVGPSGSGKTTLAAVLAGLLRPTGGEVRIEPSSSRMGTGRGRPRVSFVPQTVNMMLDRSACDNVALGAMEAGVTWAEAISRSNELLRTVGLSHRVQERASRLSGGERQRVAIARALVSERPFLVADEPTGQLDYASTTAVLSIFHTIKRQVGLLVVTHDERVAASCDRRIVMRDGSLVDA